MMKRLIKSLLSLNPFSITALGLLLVIILFLIGIPILDLIELKTYDLRFRSRGVLEPTPEVVLAVIDEKSLDQEGKWPWPRSKIAQLVNILSEDGAKVIGFDVFFSEPDENTNLKFISQLDQEIRSLDIENRKLNEFIEEKKRWADNDLLLADAIKSSKATVVLCHFFYLDKEGLGYEIDQKEIDSRLKLINNSRYPLLRYEQQDMAGDPFTMEFLPYAPEVNIEVLSRAAESSGYLNMVTDEDGIVRWMPMTLKLGQEVYSPLSIQMVWHYLDRPSMIVDVASYGVEGIRMGKTFIPTDESGKLLLNYLGPNGLFPQYSITDILHKKVPKGTFTDKIVLIGSIAIGAHDLRNTPFSPAHPGLEVHATIIDNILKNRFLNKPDWTKIYDILAMLVLASLAGIVLPRVGAFIGVLFTGGLFICHMLASQWFFSNYQLWVNMVYPPLALLLTYTSLTLYHYFVEEKSKRFLHATFTSYLSPELIEDMVKSETMPELGGEARVVTAYFTDIQSFSTFSEILTAHQLVELLNQYLTAMTDILIAERGTLDKYEGDAIIAFLGAPLELPDHALRACRVAVSMQNALLDLREKWGNEKQLPHEPGGDPQNFSPEIWAPGDKWPGIVHGMKMRIGVNTGDIVVGNMGSTMRMNYTMMGDAVNLAARLEEGAKQFGIYTAVSEYTMNEEYLNERGEKEKVRDAVEVRFIDNIMVVGKSEPVKLYELCAMKGGLSDQEKELFKRFDQGMAHYLDTQWDAAIERFSESLKIERVPDGITTPSEVFLKRCHEFKENPPVPAGEKWDGVFRMTKK